MSVDSLNVPEPIYIDQDQQLADYCSRWQQESYLAMDTEFVRTSTFYPRTGLIQVADSQGSYLVDPLTINDWAPFKSLLENPDVIKVFHAPVEDLEVCLNLVGAIPSPMHDSQLAAALAGMDGIMGFQRLVKAVLDIDLDKGETRSNWLARPLTERQIDYAVADVHFLYQIYPKLIERLESLGRLQWWQEDCQRVIDSYPLRDDFSNAFRKVKLAWKLRHQEQYTLQQLTVWREKTARQLDVPRNQVITEQSLWNLARYKAENFDGLKKAGVPAMIIKKYQKVLLATIDEGQNSNSELWPLLIERPLHPQQGELYKTLKKLVTAKAEELNIPGDLLVKKKPLEKMLRNYLFERRSISHAEAGKKMPEDWQQLSFALPEVFSGWRKEEISRSLIQHLINL